MPFIFSTLVESAKLLGLYVVFTLNTAVANPLFPNENSTVAFVSEDEYGLIGSIHYRSPEYRHARLRLMHPGGPKVDVNDRAVFEIWIKTDLGLEGLVDIKAKIKQTMLNAIARGGIARNEAKTLGRAVGIDEVRSAGVDFDRRIRSQLNEIARTAGGGTIISTGPFTEAFEGQYNAQLGIKYDLASGQFSISYHSSRGFARSPRGISAENLEKLAKLIDELAKDDNLSAEKKNNILATEINAEDSPYGERLKTTGSTFCQIL